MKSAEDWAAQMVEESINNGGWDSEQDGILIIKQIQLDAWKQGMSDAQIAIKDLQERFKIAMKVKVI